MLIIWLIGWFFTVGLTLGDDARHSEIISLLIYWPLRLGQYVRSKLE